MQKYLNLCKKECYNFLSPFGLGDTLMLCGFKESWECKNNGQIHFIIKPSHEVIMKLYGITNYTVTDIDTNNLLKNAPYSEYPILGELFIAHMAFNNFGNDLLNNKFNNFIQLYKDFLKLDEDTQFISPKNKPIISKETKRKLEKIGDISKIILFAPNAKSVSNFNNQFWDKLARNFIKKGFIILVNDELNNYKIKNAININYSLEDTLAIALMCNKFVSLRSGLCDILAQYNINMTVYYNNKLIYELYSLKKLFRKNNIQEEIIYINKKNNNNLKKFLTNLFSVRNNSDKTHKLITILGLKIKIKRKQK